MDDGSKGVEAKYKYDRNECMMDTKVRMVETNDGQEFRRGEGRKGHE